jgi:hypothetical protein
MDLPREIWQHIAQHISIKRTCSLRLVCKLSVVDFRHQITMFCNNDSNLEEDLIKKYGFQVNLYKSWVKKDLMHKVIKAFNPVVGVKCHIYSNLRCLALINVMNNTPLDVSKFAHLECLYSPANDLVGLSTSLRSLRLGPNIRVDIEVPNLLEIYGYMDSYKIVPKLTKDRSYYPKRLVTGSFINSMYYIDSLKVPESFVWRG